MQNEAIDAQRNAELEKWKCWDDFIKQNTSAGFRQLSVYAAHKASHNGWKNFTTILRDGEAIVGGAVVFRRSFGHEKCYYYIPDGPAFLDSDSDSEREQVFRAIMDFMSRSGRAKGG